jgi:hypothetical protein
MGYTPNEREAVLAVGMVAPVGFDLREVDHVDSIPGRHRLAGREPRAAAAPRLSTTRATMNGAT